MAIKIDKRSYPDRFEALLGIAELNAVFEGFAKKIPPVFNKMTFVSENPAAKDIDARYLAPGAAHPVKVDTKTKATIEALRVSEESGTETTIGSWEDVRTGLLSQFTKELDEKVIPAFYKSKDFQAFHKRKLIEDAVKDMKSANAVAKKNGIKNVRGLKPIIAALALGETSKATALAQKLIKAEKINVDAAAFIKDLQAGKSAGTVKEQKVDISLTTLKKCGFSDPKDKIIHKWLKTLVQAMNDNDRVLFQSACSKIQLQEPKGSEIAKMNSTAFLKMLFKAKVII